MRYSQADLATWSYDQDRMNATVRGIEAQQPTGAECRRLAMLIHTRKQQIDQGNAAMAQFQEDDAAMINSPKLKPPVYCHSNGMMVACQ